MKSLINNLKIFVSKHHKTTIILSKLLLIVVDEKGLIIDIHGWKNS